MKHIKKYNESSQETNPGINYRKDITKEDKEYFDIVFADFIDAGAKSSLFENNISYSSPSTPRFTNRINIQYKIDINLDEQYANDNKRVGGVYPVTNTRNGVNKDLIKYTQYMLDNTLEIESCIDKIKIEHPYIYSSISLWKGSFGSNDGPFKMSLFIYHL